MIKDMTAGKPAKVLILFSLPMLLSTAFQQLYNIADNVIAGKFIGEGALAAVGASYPITMIFMAIALGANIGCSVVISRLFGAKSYEKMKTAVSTSFISVLAISLVLTAAGFIFCKPLMRVMNTPSDIFSDSVSYLNIYIAGLCFLFLYNTASGVMTALGDSNTALYFLIASSVGNVGLDLLFVCSFDWGVAGLAWATFIAQGIACILSVIVLKFKLAKIKTENKPKAFSAAVLKEISLVSVPSIFQQSFISVGNLFVQGLINKCGSSVIAGFSAASKLSTFAVVCLNTMGTSISSFTAQNMGSGKPERVTKSFRAGIAVSYAVMVVFFAGYFFFPEFFLKLFMDKDESAAALQTGREFLRIVSPFYFVVAIKVIADGVLRGAEHMRIFMVTTFTDLFLRVILSYILFDFYGTTGIWLSWPIGWIPSSLLSLIFFLTGIWKKKPHKDKLMTEDNSGE